MSDEEKNDFTKGLSINRMVVVASTIFSVLSFFCGITWGVSRFEVQFEYMKTAALKQEMKLDEISNRQQMNENQINQNAADISFVKKDIARHETSILNLK